MRVALPAEAGDDTPRSRAYLASWHNASNHSDNAMWKGRGPGARHRLGLLCCPPLAARCHAARPPCPEEVRFARPVRSRMSFLSPHRHPARCSPQPRLLSRRRNECRLPGAPVLPQRHKSRIMSGTVYGWAGVRERPCVVRRRLDRRRRVRRRDADRERSGMTAQRRDVPGRIALDRQEVPAYGRDGP